MESAIGQHLTCPRTLSRRVPEDYLPPFPMWVGRADPAVQQVVMGYLGVQFAAEDQRPAALDAMAAIVASFAAADGPAGYDLTYHLDNQGCHNLIVAGYWSDPVAHRRWLCSPDVAGWWESGRRLTDGLGCFREITAPRVGQFETLYAFQERMPGVGAVMDRTSGEINEHAYWGSMRERFPLSQTDWMSAAGELKVVSGDPAQGGRVVVRGHDNIALIRSGQDWKERWAESHPTRLRIFTTFFRVAAGLEKLRLYHEVSVWDSNDQIFEYINCHPQTGMMRDAVAGS